MAKLSIKHVSNIWAKFMSDNSLRRESLGGITKKHLKVTINEIDLMADSNLASLKSAFLANSKQTMTFKQIAELYTIMVRTRTEVL